MNIKEKKQEQRGKMQIGVGSMVTVKVGEMEEKSRVGTTIILRKEVVGCVQDNNVLTFAHRLLIQRGYTFVVNLKVELCCPVSYALCFGSYDWVNNIMS